MLSLSLKDIPEVMCLISKPCKETGSPLARWEPHTEADL